MLNEERECWHPRVCLESGTVLYESKDEVVCRSGIIPSLNKEL